MDDGSSFAHLRDANTANATNSKLFAGKFSGQIRPREAGFLFATFSLPAQRKSRRKKIKVIERSIEVTSSDKNSRFCVPTLWQRRGQEKFRFIKGFSKDKLNYF